MKIKLVKAIESSIDGVEINEPEGAVFEIQSTEDNGWIVDNGTYSFPVYFTDAVIVPLVSAGDKVRLYCQGSIDEPSYFYGVVEDVKKSYHPYRPNQNGEYEYTYIARVCITGDDIVGSAHGFKNGHIEFHNHARLIKLD